MTNAERLANAEIACAKYIKAKAEGRKTATTRFYGEFTGWLHQITKTEMPEDAHWKELSAQTKIKADEMLARLTK